VAAARGKAPREQIVRFHSLGAALENEVNREIDMRGLLARKEAEIRKHKDEMAAADMDEKNALVDEEVRRYKNLADLLSKEAETAPMPVAARGSAPVTKTRIAEVIGALLSEENDPRIFDASPALTRIYGKPSVLLLPSRGVAIYERDRNMIIVPVTPRDTLEEAVARAFAEYRLDADEDESLRFSYRDLNDNLKKLSIRNLRKSFIKDYVTWMTGGAKGQKAMNKYVKAWFDAKLH